MTIRSELIEELLAGKDPAEVFSQDGLADELRKAVAERILNAGRRPPPAGNCPAAQRGHVGLGPSFINEDQPPGGQSVPGTSSSARVVRRSRGGSARRESPRISQLSSRSSAA